MRLSLCPARTLRLIPAHHIRKTASFTDAVHQNAIYIRETAYFTDAVYQNAIRIRKMASFTDVVLRMNYASQRFSASYAAQPKGCSAC